MIPFGLAEAMARALEIRADLGLGSDLCACDAVVSRAIEHAGLDAVALPPDDTILSQAYGVLDRQMGSIWYRQDLAGHKKSHLLAHELGHWWLHDDRLDTPDGESEVRAEWRGYDQAMTEVDGYSPVQRREMEANAFAAELLAPLTQVKEAFMNGSSARSIALSLGVDESLVVGQLVLGVLTAFTPEPGERTGTTGGPDLDADQRSAARSQEYRTLVLAGPGSGKTRALAARAAYLLECGARPERILALTFTRNAAEELRRRIVRAAGSAARSLAAYTIHGFGLELLRRFGHHVGLSPCPLIVDRVGSIRILEEIIAQGDGGELECLDAPTYPITELGDAIVAWKERGLRPHDLHVSEGRGQALLHAVRVYELYEARLRSMDAVDFPDLVARTVDMLSGCPEALNTVRDEYDHVLVDEIQDVDPLSWRLVELIAGLRARLWAVGDPLQAIYSFRVGQAMVNEAEDRFDDVHCLRRSYRFGPRTASLVNALAQRLGLSESAAIRNVAALPDGPIVAAQAADEEAEINEIAAHLGRMETWLGRGCRQAVLCRTNGQAKEIANGLRMRGIPACGPAGALDVSAVRDALAAMVRSVGLSMTGGIADDEAAVCPDLMEALEPIEILARWLFGDTGAARALAGPNRALDRSGLVWLWGIAAGRRMEESHGVEGSSGKMTLPVQESVRRVLADIRRAMAIGDDRLMLEAEQASAASVAVMTIHAAKGLEFDAVVVPRVNIGCFPPRPRPRMLELVGDERHGDGYSADEARLLYVAASRSRRSFVVSCCGTIGRRKASPSPLFDAARDAVAAVGGTVCAWRSCSAGEMQAPAVRLPQAAGPRVLCSNGALETYGRCPKRYWFEHAASHSAVEVGPYVVYVTALRESLRTMRRAADLADHVLRETAIRKWDDVWNSSRVAHDWTPMYRRRAEEAIRVACEHPEWRKGDIDVSLALEVENGTVELHADRLECIAEGSVVLERFIWRGRRKNTPASGRARLLYAAAKAQWPDADIRLQDRYMLTGEVVPLERPKDRGAGAMARADRLLQSMRLGRFDPRPGDQCVSCPYLLLCDRGVSSRQGVEMNNEEQEDA